MVQTIFEAASEGNIEAVQAAIDPRRLELRRDSNGDTALHLAAKHGHYDVARLLLQQGFSPRSKNHRGETPLHEAARSNHVSIAKALLAAGASPYVKSKDDNTCFDIAIIHNSLGMIVLLLDTASPAEVLAGLSAALRSNRGDILAVYESHCDPKIGDKSGTGKLLGIAAAQGDALAIQYLLEHGLNPDAADENGTTALHLAASRGDADVINRLVEAGADVNARDFVVGGTPLFAAIQDQNLETVKLLLAAGASTDVVIQMGRLRRDLVHITCQSETPEILQLLLDGGADPTTLDESGGTAASHAAGKGHLKTLSLLHSAGCAVLAASRDGTTPLLRAALGGHTEVISWLLDHGAGVNTSDAQGATSLAAAIQNQHIDSIRLLCQRGAEITWQDIVEASSYGNIDMTTFLLSSDAISASGLEWRIGLLNIAVTAGKTALARELVRRGHGISELTREHKLRFLYDSIRDEDTDSIRAFLEQCDDRSLAEKISLLTPIHLAAEMGNLVVFTMLVDAGFPVSQHTQYGQTALHQAARQGRVEIIRELRRSISSEIRDQNGNTPLHWAAVNGHDAAVRELLHQGANIQAKDQNGITPLHMACSKGHVAVAEALLEAGAMPSATWRGPSNALHLAVQTSDEIVQRILATELVDVNAHDDLGATPLMLAATRETASMLLERGACLSAVSSEGLNALCNGARGGKADLFAYLFPKFEDWLGHRRNQTKLWHLVCQGGDTEVFKFLQRTQLSFGDLDPGDLMPLLAEALAQPNDFILSNIVEVLLSRGFFKDVNFAHRILLLVVDAGCVETARCLGSLRGIFEAGLGGTSPMDLAKESKDSNLVEALLEAGAGRPTGSHEGYLREVDGESCLVQDDIAH